MLVVTAGPHGGLNLGDDLILEYIVRALSTMGHEVVALAEDPSYVEQTLGISASRGANLRRGRLPSTRVLREADAVVVAGGEQLQEGRLGNPLWSLLARVHQVATIADRVGTPVFVWAIGAEDMRSRIGRRMLRSTMRHVADGSTRDPASQRYVASVTGRVLPLAADPVWAADIAGSEVRARARAQWGLPTEPFCLFVPAADTSHSQFMVKAVKAAAQWAHRHGLVLAVHLTDLQPSGDLKLLNAIQDSKADAVVLPFVRPGPGTVEALYAEATCTISARMHPLILSITQGRPCLALLRDAKLRNFAQDARIANIELPEAETELVGKADTLLTEPAAVVLLPTMRERAQKTTRLFEEFAHRVTHGDN